LSTFKGDRKDDYEFFREPVDASAVPDYYKIIKNPMDLTTVRQKLTSDAYTSVQEFRDDVERIYTNCKIFNPPESVYVKSATKLWEYARKVIDKESKSILPPQEKVVQAQPVVLSPPTGTPIKQHSVAKRISNHNKRTPVYETLLV
jgi:hypothetical protein